MTASPFYINYDAEWTHWHSIAPVCQLITILLVFYINIVKMIHECEKFIWLLHRKWTRIHTHTCHLPLATHHFVIKYDIEIFNAENVFLIFFLCGIQCVFFFFFRFGISVLIGKFAMRQPAGLFSPFVIYHFDRENCLRNNDEVNACQAKMDWFPWLTTESR